MVTLVERHSRFTALVKVPSKDTAVVVAALSRQIRKLPATLRRWLTWDRGLEMAKHKTFTVATDVKVYFCDPQSPWHRGSNENTNELLRQCFPKRTDLSGHTQSDLDKVALRLIHMDGDGVTRDLGLVGIPFEIRFEWPAIGPQSSYLLQRAPSVVSLK